MIHVYAKEVNGTWFGLAHSGKRIIATAMDSDRERTLKTLTRIIPRSSEHEVVEKASDFAEDAIMKLEKAHRSMEDFGAFALATEHVPEPLASVLKIAASIPLGYVASYGGIAKAAGTDAQTVGRIMASNPLYPIVACHRVVGSDFSLVGYGGRKSPNALKAKLARLSAECRGFKSPREVSTDGLKLAVYPTERAIHEAKRQGLSLSAKPQRKLTSYA
jgi:O-6-methylguanine DNA methyltransferase